MFPQQRLRRLRRTPAIRSLVSSVQLRADALVMPCFVVTGRGRSEPIASLPGQARLSPDRLLEVVRRAAGVGVRAVLLFGIPEGKDEEGSVAWADNGPVPVAVQVLKEALPELVVMTDVCLCEYTSHGHCGPLHGDTVDNDRALDLLARAATCYARAGADIVAPSDMMDGRVGVIRKALDNAGHTGTGILSYAVKYASAFYGPFREAAGSAPAAGDRRGYQMDPSRDVREALQEVQLDLAEGADLIMVKPGLPYLDVLAAIRKHCNVPVAAYCVSGEYAMIKAAAARGWADERACALEMLTALTRAGADFIVTYWAEAAATWISRF